jgi:menaquinol-cytochrome c reductase iron-sulfur subunit
MTAQMPEQKPEVQTEPNRTRRALITYLPIGIVAGVFGSLFTAAFRFLRPMVSSVSDAWIDVAHVNELSGLSPIARKLTSERTAGWAVATEEHNVYVLPAKNNKVLSAICPHEGCEVNWESESKVFLCPCHESSFAADGSPIKGPSQRGLGTLPSRVQDGKLQVQYRFYEDNSQERNTRA